ncbi:MAG TPA: PaaI family thioesterase [Firmicutes bacterium]|nr:PaaI family thioesterase [Candidatus Fermentithermobacillaceae bacterium]
MGSDNPTLGANHCFGCGPINPYGLRLKIEENGDSWQAFFVPEDYHCGWPGVVHGGVLSTALDEVMSYIAYGKGLMAVTARLAIEFKRPCAPGKRLLIRAWPLKVSRRIVEAQAEIRLEDGTVAATATGKFLILSEEQKKVFGGEHL